MQDRLLRNLLIYSDDHFTKYIVACLKNKRSMICTYGM